ncbi:MAG: efflux RND transporter periplasmic adaptor subunit, partial [Bacteroidia bacterium]
SETYASLVNTGNPAKVFFPDINKSIEAKVSYSAKVISQVTRTFGIEIQLPSDDIYKPNMVSQIRVVDYSKPDAFVAPINTIQNSDNKSFIYIASKNGTRNVTKKVEVKVGKSYNGNAEILAGLNKGDLLITTGFQDLNDNELIKF